MIFSALPEIYFCIRLIRFLMDGCVQIPVVVANVVSIIAMGIVSWQLFGVRSLFSLVGCLTSLLTRTSLIGVLQVSQNKQILSAVRVESACCFCICFRFHLIYPWLVAVECVFLVE